MSRIAPTFPATQATPNSTSVVTQTGLTQGDLVYFNNGDYKSPANLTAPSTVAFSAPQPQLIMSGGVGGVASPVFSYTDMQTTYGFGSSQNQAMAVLTNGNIVQVWRSFNNSYPMFRIVNSSGAIVVAATTISTSSTFTINNHANPTVVALTGGGFAVMFNDNSSNPAYAIYTNTGSVTTAATSDALPSGTLNTYQQIVMTPLANGGFAVAAMSSNPNLYYKVYTSTGGTTFAWANLGTIGSTSSTYSIASRSDSSFCITYFDSSTYNSYSVFSATGSPIVSSASLGGNYNQSCFDVTCLANGTTFAFVYSDNSQNISVKFLPTGNTLSASTTILPNSNTFSTSGFGSVRVLAQASGGFAIFALDVSFGALYVAFYNSTATSFYPSTNSNGTVPLAFPTFSSYYPSGYSYAPKGTVYENGGNVYFAQSLFNNTNYNFSIISINETTYSLNVPTSVSSTSLVNSSISSSVAAGSVVSSSITPTKLNYYPASTASFLSTQSPAVVVPQTTLFTTNSVSNLVSTTLSDGRFAIGYINGSNYNVIVNVFSSSGTLLTTLTLGQTYGTALIQMGLKLFALASGKLGIAFPNPAGTSLSVYIYNSSYSITSSTTALGLTSVAASYLYNDGQGWGIAGSVTTDQIGVVYTQSNGNIYLAIFDNSFNLLNTISVVTNSVNYLGLSAGQNGSFLVTYWYSSFTYFKNYSPTSSNFSSYITSSYGLNTSSSYPFPNQYKSSFSGGTSTYLAYINSSNYPSLNYYNSYNTSFSYGPSRTLSTGASSVNSIGGFNAIGTTGYGTFTYIQYNSGTSFYIIGGAYGSTYSSSYSVPVSATLQLTNVSVYGSGPQFTVTPGVGYTSVVAWLNNNQYPTFSIINTCPLYVPYLLTAGASVSNPVTISPSPIPSSSTINNAVLMGVANNTASAGTGASITTNGLATLNTNYNASTAFQSFDYQAPNGTGIQGVKGTIVGRNVNLIGNN